MKQPKIEIKPEPIDRLLEIVGLLGLLLMIGLVLYYFDKLPESLPKHFGLDGKPDSYGSKASLWLLPIIGCLMYPALFWLNKFPHKFNYPQRITEENAERSYKMVTRITRVLNTLMIWAFAYITYATIQTALGNQNGLSRFFMTIFTLLFLTPTCYIVFKEIKGEYFSKVEK